MIMSNIVKKGELREIQLAALKEISEALICSFGPMGSNTLIIKDGALNRYTKDGHSILSNIKLSGVIEHSIIEDLVPITKNIVKEVGDNTTSAIILAYLIFKAMVEMENSDSELPFVIIDNFKKAVKMVSDIVEKNKRECTLEDIYNITYTSTNGNAKLAEKMYTIYQNYGMNVFIDVTTSNTGEDLIKEYDGLTIDTGYSDVAYVNVKGKGISRIRNPRIYVFQDPVDTPEIMGLMYYILVHNILAPMQANRSGSSQEMIPTVIMTPKISRDLSAYIEQLINMVYSMPENNRPPLLIISNIHQQDQFMDIARICGAKIICKYINAQQQEKDIVAGLAPTPTTVHTFCGEAELVESSVNKTKFINPIGMRQPEEGDDTTGVDNYKSLVENVEGMILAAKEDGKDAAYIGALKRRLNSLKANMVEYLVGGVSAADRDMAVDLLEDAVLNCRSAAEFGVGNGANFEALKAASSILNDISDVTCEVEVMKYVDIIYQAYVDVTRILYGTINIKEYEADKIISTSLVKDVPFNLRTGEYDGKVLTSIKSDITTLDTLAKILTIMITSNQALIQNPMVNTYYSEERVKNSVADDFTMSNPAKPGSFGVPVENTGV